MHIVGVEISMAHTAPGEPVEYDALHFDVGFHVSSIRADFGLLFKRRESVSTSLLCVLHVVADPVSARYSLAMKDGRPFDFAQGRLRVCLYVFSAFRNHSSIAKPSSLRFLLAEVIQVE
jgi:hypothetical protein